MEGNQSQGEEESVNRFLMEREWKEGEREVDRRVGNCNDMEQNTEEERNGQNMNIWFWNVSGIHNKDKDFWDFLENMDVVGLLETWDEKLEEKKEEGRTNKKWIKIPAWRSKKKGRAKGGIWIGVRSEIQVRERTRKKELISLEMQIRGSKIVITFIYNNEGMKSVKTLLEQEYEDHGRNSPWLIVGDFNARIGEDGSLDEEECEKKSGSSKRKSKDIVINSEGRELLKMTQDLGVQILNGNWKGDLEGSFTYVSTMGRSVIDYGLVNKEAEALIASFEVIENNSSDHLPIKLETNIQTGRRENKNRDRMEQQGRKYFWNEKGIKAFKEKMENRERKILDGSSKVKEDWEGIKELFKEGKGEDRNKKISYRRGRGSKERRRSNWWTEKLGEKKKSVKKKWSLFKRASNQEVVDKRRSWLKEKREYKKMVKDRKKEKKEEERNKIRRIKSEKEFWKFVKSNRRQRDKKIQIQDMELWRKYFMELLAGEERRKMEEVEVKEEEWLDTEEITREEVKKAIKKLKEGKAAGIDEIGNEEWKNAPEYVIENLCTFLNKIWNGQQIPEDWRTAIIVPCYKKGDSKDCKNYRGISLLSSGYKIYAHILGERLKRWMDAENILPEWQAGFRKGRGTIENVYILKRLAGRELRKSKGRLYTFFVDFSSAFDMVRREELWKNLEHMNVNKKLLAALKGLYSVTLNKVKIGGNYSEVFQTKKGVRQGCPLSPTLFNLYLADLEESIRENNIGDVKIGGKKVVVLAYADDLVFMAKSVYELQRIIKMLELYEGKKGLKVNLEKSKIMIMKKGRKKSKKEKWLWKKKEIECVKTYNYLGYIMNYNNESSEHIKYTVAKVNRVLGKLWWITEVYFPTEFKVKMKIFNKIVKPMIMYAVEIWGWQEMKQFEGLLGKYVKWILGLDRNVPAYIWRTETGQERLRVEMVLRYWKFERKSRNRAGILKEIIEEERKDRYRQSIRFEESENMAFSRMGLDRIELMEREEEGQEVEEIIKQRIMDIDWQRRNKEIEESKFCDYYKDIKPNKAAAKYLEESGIRREDQVMLARFRSGCEFVGCRRWKDEQSQNCRVCKKEKENILHVLVCVMEREFKSRSDSRKEIRRVVGEDGEGLEDLRRIRRRWKKEKE